MDSSRTCQRSSGDQNPVPDGDLAIAKSDSTEGLLVSEAQLNQITALGSDSCDTADAFPSIDFSTEVYTIPRRTEWWLHQRTIIEVDAERERA